MKSNGLCLLLLLLSGAIFVGNVHAGIIPASLIQSDEENEKISTCKDLEERRSEILKKLSKLKHEEEQYVADLEKMQKDYCK